ncbi:protein turtle homolog B-like [Amphiura filiformis]|uniref:protein turtle homolog B-like n=1 Tax=Amphiura filiformis TaxID=82378 RepID=UPI003B20E5FD
MFVGSQLLFSRIATFDRGSYQCNATNEHGSVISPSTLIYVDVPLTFTLTPDSVMSLHEGDNVTLACNISGYPHPIITWYKDNYMLNNDYHRTITRVYSELYSWAHLEFTTIKYTDSGLYVCEAQNRNQAITYASEVIVQVTPQITTHHPKGMIVHIGDPFTLECRATGIPPPTYTWYHNGKSIARIADSHFTENEGVLSIQESFGTDAGEYYCQVVNTVGEVYSPVTVLFIDGLHFLNQPPPNVYILKGTSKELECIVAGTKKATRVEWYRDDKKIRPRCTPKIFPPDCQVDVQGNTLFLNSVGIEEQGTYMCVAREIEGIDPQQIRTRATVHIMVPPVFSPHLPSVIEGRRLGDLTINCTAAGKPPPKIEWLKSGITMSNDTFREIKGGLFYISELHTRDNGKFICTATNPAGTVAQVIRIHVNSGPARLNATIKVTSWSATLNWKVRLTNGNKINHFEMEYQEVDPEITTWMGVGGDIPGDARQFTLMDLKANTTYQVHMWAVNKEGIGEILTKLFVTAPIMTNTVPRGIAGNHLIIVVSAVSVIICLILLLVCIVLTRKNSRFWFSKNQEDGHSLINSQQDSPSSGSVVNPAFGTENGGKQGGMELHEVTPRSTVYGTTSGKQEVVDTSA